MTSRTLRGVALAIAALTLVPPAFAQQDQGRSQGVITRRGTAKTSPSARVYTNVPGVGIVGYTDAETKFINRMDQLLGEYQLKNPYTPGSSQWRNYVNSLVEWYQQQNPYEYGTTNWRAYNNRIIDWYLRQNPFEQNSENWESYAEKANQFSPTQVYARPQQPQQQQPLAQPQQQPPYQQPLQQQPDYQQYMREVYDSNPYVYGTPEWQQYVNYYINEYNRLYGSADVAPEQQTLTPEQPLPYAQPPATSPPDWTEPSSVLPQRRGTRLPVTAPLAVPPQGTTQPPTAYPKPEQQNVPPDQPPYVMPPPAATQTVPMPPGYNLKPPAAGKGEE